MNLKPQLNHMNPVRPEPVEGLNGIYVHPTGECEETRTCFDWAQHERVSRRPTDFFRMTPSHLILWNRLCSTIQLSFATISLLPGGQITR
jgi:hypothetical protein